MTNKNNETKYQITERVFSIDGKSFHDILNSYFEKKVEKAINGLYDKSEEKATPTEREVA